MLSSCSCSFCFCFLFFADLVLASYNPVDFHREVCGRGWRRVRTRSFRSRGLFPVGFSVFSRALADHDALFSPLGRFGCFCYGSRWLWLCLICIAKCCFLDLV
ncbi:unnamed protein product [Prunus brigantina]